jgi:prophage antirepressor-like protein
MSYEEKVTSETITFASQEFGNIRVLDIDGQPWFVGKDVAAALGYVNTKQAIADHVDEDDKLKSDGVVIRDPMGRKQNPVIINESGLYSLILSSKLEGAQKFKKWVTSEVLPSIRKTGQYVAPTATAPVKSAEEMQFMRDKLEKERREVDLERARFLRSMSLSYSGKSETFPQILDAYAVHEIVGTFALPLPEIKQRLMTAGEVGKALGISAHKVGLLANKHGVKVEAYGSWVRDKSRYSAKEVDTFRYNNEGLEKIRQIALEEETK